MAKDYDALRKLLETEETYPFEYMHKFTGRDTPAFRESLARFEARFPKLKKQGERPSGSGTYAAVTYLFHAESAEQIIEMLKATGEVEDLILVL